MREAVRAIVVRAGTDGHPAAVLLARSHDRHDPDRSWWELPGGGIEPGEDLHQALRRELREETGYLDLSIGHEVCHWTTTWAFSDRDVTQHDRVFAVTLQTTEQVAPTPLASEGLAEVVWVPLAMLDDLGAPLVPGNLTDLIDTLDDRRPPTTIAMPSRIPWPPSTDGVG